MGKSDLMLAEPAHIECLFVCCLMSQQPACVYLQDGFNIEHHSHMWHICLHVLQFRKEQVRGKEFLWNVCFLGYFVESLFPQVVALWKVFPWLAALWKVYFCGWLLCGKFVSGAGCFVESVSLAGCFVDSLFPQLVALWKFYFCSWFLCGKWVSLVVYHPSNTQSVSRGWIYWDNVMCCHTEREVPDQSSCLTESGCTDKGPTCPSIDLIQS